MRNNRRPMGKPMNMTRVSTPKEPTSPDIIVQRKSGSWFHGDVHFYDYLTTEPIPGYKNIPYVRDLPAVQCNFAGMHDKASMMITKYKSRMANISAFITMTDSLADHTRSHYVIDVPHGIFRAYSSWFDVPTRKRDEIVYLDNSGTSPLWFNDHLKFLSDITRSTGIPTVFVSKKFHEVAVNIIKGNGYSVLARSPGNYDHASKYGILMLSNPSFNQAHEAMPRKLLTYLMCGMKPIMDGPWIESIKYVRQNDIEPFIYSSISDISRIGEHEFGAWEPHSFCMKSRINDLHAEIKRLRGLVR